MSRYKNAKIDFKPIPLELLQPVPSDIDIAQAQQPNIKKVSIRWHVVIGSGTPNCPEEIPQANDFARNGEEDSVFCIGGPPRTVRPVNVDVARGRRIGAGDDCTSAVHNDELRMAVLPRFDEDAAGGQGRDVADMVLKAPAFVVSVIFLGVKGIKILVL